MRGREPGMDANKLTLRSQAALDGARQQALARSRRRSSPSTCSSHFCPIPRGSTVPCSPRHGRGTRAAARPGGGGPRPHPEGLRAGRRGSARSGPGDGPRCRLPRGGGARRRVRLDRAPVARALGGVTEAARILRDAGVERDAVLQALTRRCVGANASPTRTPRTRSRCSNATNLTRSRATRHARPGDRSRRRDPPRDPGALPQDQEQPRRSGNRVWERRRSWRGSRSESSRATCRSPSGTSASSRWIWAR